VTEASGRVRLTLVRHGHAAAGWTEDADPDLDDEGRAQADAMAAALAPEGPLSIVTSPLRRARATAEALERVWRRAATTEARLGEIPSPSGLEGAIANRGPWLGNVMRSRWDDPELGPDLQAWRERLLDALVGMSEPTVITSHFIAINVAVGAATGDSRVTCFRPNYCSRTVIEVDRGRLRLVTLGGEAETLVR
jgi:broad specificity phosphatase PhoE